MKLPAASLALAVFLAAPFARADHDAPPKEHHGAAPWVLVGVGGASAAIGVLSFVGAVKAHADVASESLAKGCTASSAVACPSGVDGSNIQRNLDGEHAMNVIGVVLTAAGGAAIVTGLLWHFLEHGRSNVAVVVAPTFAPGAGMLSVAARF